MCVPLPGWGDGAGEAPGAWHGSCRLPAAWRRSPHCQRDARGFFGNVGAGLSPPDLPGPGGLGARVPALCLPLAFEPWLLPCTLPWTGRPGAFQQVSPLGPLPEPCLASPGTSCRGLGSADQSPLLRPAPLGRGLPV